MNVRQAAERLEVSASLVYSLISTGRLRCSRHGLGRGCIRISDDQLEEYRAASLVEPPPRTPYESLRL
jgi:excisionase family DNA binding protein